MTVYLQFLPNQLLSFTQLEKKKKSYELWAWFKCPFPKPLPFL